MRTRRTNCYNIPMITSVIFDMDGLLFDTEVIYFECYKKAAKEWGLDFPFELFTACIGISREEAEKFMKQHFGDVVEPSQVHHRTYELVEEYLQNGGPISFRPGAKEAVEFFYKRGLKIGLASSNMRKWAEFYLREKGIYNYFSAITTCEEVKKLKPNPEVYLKTAQKLGAVPEQCLVFEDSAPGATAAIAANMRTCMVPQLSKPTRLIREQAFKIYHSLEDIYPDIDELLA